MTASLHHPYITAEGLRHWSMGGAAPYSSSVTCSPHATGLHWSSTSCIAMWVMKRLGAAPCQWSSPDSKNTVSPGVSPRSVRRGRLQWRRPSLAKVVLTLEQYHLGPAVTNTSVWLNLYPPNTTFGRFLYPRPRSTFLTKGLTARPGCGNTPRRSERRTEGEEVHSTASRYAGPSTTQRGFTEDDSCRNGAVEIRPGKKSATIGSAEG